MLRAETLIALDLEGAYKKKSLKPIMVFNIFKKLTFCSYNVLFHFSLANFSNYFIISPSLSWFLYLTKSTSLFFQFWRYIKCCLRKKGFLLLWFLAYFMLLWYIYCSRRVVNLGFYHLQIYWYKLIKTWSFGISFFLLFD